MFLKVGMKQEIWIGIFECGVVGVEIFFDKYIIFNNLIAIKNIINIIFIVIQKLKHLF